MRIDYIREFLHAAKLGNFSVAASELYITQPTLTRHIALLEKELGAPLFYQSDRKMELTDAGKYARQAFEDMIEKYDALQKRIQVLQKGMQGTLKIGLISCGTDSVVTPHLQSFCAEFPEVQTNLSFQAHNMEQDILSGKIDVGEIVLSSSNKYKQLKAHPIYRASYSAMMQKTHPLSSKPDLTLTDLQGEEIILLKADDTYSDNIRYLFSSYGLSPKYIYADEINSVVFTQRQRGGIFLTRTNWHNFSYQDTVFRLLNNGTLFHEYAFAYKESNLNSVVELFIRHIQASMKKGS